jgi:hypothetical protein
MGLRREDMTDIKTTEVKVRNKRRPFNAPVSKLELAKQLDGWHYRWINDEPGRIARALQGDYVFAEPDEVGFDARDDNRCVIHAGTHKDGSVMYGYLMRVPMEFFLEDKATAQAHLDQIDNAIRGGSVEPIGNSYIPEGGISIKTK